ncbi:MAG: hypothetical protein AB1473_16595 [Thermodesulfobacteriota bacterium]
MKKTRYRMKAPNLALLSLCCALISLTSALAEEIFVPAYLYDRGIAQKTNPLEIADTCLGIPYRDDGTIDDRGYFTTFNRPDRVYDTPGLNCSGLVLSVGRFLFNKNFTLEQATRDRQKNSGADAGFGKDWDFGYDLILNLTEHAPRRVIMPDTRPHPLDTSDGLTLRGFDLQDGNAWSAVLRQMQPGKIYLGSISRETGNPRRVLHYHVVLMIPDEKGGVWLYHSTRRSRAHKMNINTSGGINRLWAQFRDSGYDRKKILIVEALPPGRDHEKAPATTAGSAPQAPEPVASASTEDRLALKAMEILDNVTPTAKDTAQLGTNPRSRTDAEDEEEFQPQSPRPEPAPPTRPDPLANLTINHLSGKVFRSFPDLVTQIPRFADDSKQAIKFWFRNNGGRPRDLSILLRGPAGDFRYQGQVLQSGKDLQVVYPRDFVKGARSTLDKGKYGMEVHIDGEKWCANVFEVDFLKDASPKIIDVKVPATVASGQTFSVKVAAQNQGKESDYGGITLSAPDPHGLRLVSARPGKIYGRGSTVLSITQDKIKTKVPMAEEWIELWGENKTHELETKITAGPPGTYPLYIRCAIRGVAVKSSVILMDPASSDTVDQQGFPVKVYNIQVR